MLCYVKLCTVWIVSLWKHAKGKPFESQYVVELYNLTKFIEKIWRHFLNWLSVARPIHLAIGCWLQLFLLCIKQLWRQQTTVTLISAINTIKFESQIMRNDREAHKWENWQWFHMNLSWIANRIRIFPGLFYRRSMCTCNMDISLK
jgi:hypothetical protein